MTCPLSTTGLQEKIHFFKLPLDAGLPQKKKKTKDETIEEGFFVALTLKSY